MRTLKVLRDERAEKLEAMRSLTDVASNEKRDLTSDEKTNFDSLEGEINALDADIRRAETAEKRAKEMVLAGAGTPSDSEEKELRNYSVLTALRSAIDQKPLEGIEKEMHQEAVKEARELGQKINGIGIPSRVLQQRDNSITMPTQPADGGVLVEKERNNSMMDMLRNALVTRQLGATYMNDLVGNISFTRMTARPKATWKPEVAALDKSNIQFADDEFAPKRLGTYTIQSLQFLRQTAASVEQKIREEIIYSITEGVDEAAILGTGTNNQPLGVLNHTGITTLALGANGAALTRANLIAAETALATKNLNGRNYGWLINALTRGKLKGTQLDAGSGRFVMESNDSLLEYPVVMSNLVPSNLTKGTAAGTASAALFGDWSELYIGQWGGIDLTVDPYTLAVEGQVKIIAQGFFNVLVHRPEAFVAFKDILTA